MARMYGSDGTASRGGDLGWFSQGQMVKPFNDAVFQASSAGLLPKLTETEFGYHIIKVTAPKNNKKYLVALVEKDIIASEATKDAAFRKADEFANSIKDTADFNAKVKADSLQKFSASNIRKADRFVNNLSNARTIVKWAFNDADVEDVSNVFSLDDQYVVAILTGEREEGVASVNDVRDELTAKVRNEEKAKLISEKLSKLSGTFEKIAADFGSGATSGVAPDVTLSSNSIAAIGYDPIAIGKLFGLKKGAKTGPFKGEYGVINLELVNFTPAPEIADYSKYKNDLVNQRIGRIDYSVDEAIRKNSDIVDDRVRFF
jgi:peptidyl-prolyl cis-trans isomerase D